MRRVRRPARVGFCEGLVHDEARQNWDDDGPRPISWAAWYPASDDAMEQRMRAGGASGAWFDLGRAARDAPMRGNDETCPVVVMSHGTGGSAAALGWLGHSLASQGFVVLAPDHHGNTALGTYRAEGFLCWWERARDLSVLLDRAPIEPRFAGRIDTSRSFAACFSLGCHAAMALLGAITDVELFNAWARGRSARGPREFPDLADHLPGLMQSSQSFRAAWRRRGDSYADGRIRAALLLAPAPPVRAFTEPSLGRIAEPLHILTGGGDMEAPAEDGAMWLAERLPCCRLDLLGPEVGHFVFLPKATDEGLQLAPDLCRDRPGVDRSFVHSLAVDAAARLFTQSGA